MIVCYTFIEYIIGFISCLVKNNLWAQGYLLHIDDLIIDSDYRRMGIATLLMDEARSYGREHGCRYLELESGFQRIEAHRFYDRYGFCRRAFNFIYEI